MQCSKLEDVVLGSSDKICCYNRLCSFCLNPCGKCIIHYNPLYKLYKMATPVTTCFSLVYTGAAV